MDTNDWEKRFWAIEEIEELLSVAAPQYRKPRKYLDDLILNEENKSLAEKRLRLLEDMRAKDEEEKLLLEIDRVKRLRLEYLRDTDWTQLPDVPLSAERKKYYRKYRQFLRDLPENLKLRKVEVKCPTFEEWEKWVKSVENMPGFNNFLP